jgi:vacuolar protein sorting-associated protein 13A/C
MTFRPSPSKVPRPEEPLDSSRESGKDSSGTSPSSSPRALLTLSPCSLVTKPVVGVFDLASNVTEGIRNTTTVFDQSSIDRVRLPRFTASDGILRVSPYPCYITNFDSDSSALQLYQEREALGQNWLKNVEIGKYSTETYVAHLDIPSSEDSLVVLLTTTRILLVKILKLKVGWDVPLSDLQTISLAPAGISESPPPYTLYMY